VRLASRIFAVFLFGVVAAAHIAGSPLQTATVHVAAAADLQPVLPAVVGDFEKQTGKHVEVSYASSSVLATQILNGAPFDLFLSADMSFPQKLTDAGLADPPIEYAEGTLVLWARKDSPLQPLTIDSFQSSKLHRLAVANPDHAPYGRAARASLEHLHLTAMLQPKLVVAENIAQAALFAESANTDAGLISLTSAMTEKFRREGTYFLIPRDAYPPLAQGAVVLKHSPGAAGGQMLLEFLLSAGQQKQLAQRGLQPVK
jgi:molybdate transport system substrate-binding protein